MTDQPKTVKVRIPVAVDSVGRSAANLYADQGHENDWNYQMEGMMHALKPGYSRYWLEAELPLPEITTVQATVTKEPSK